MSKTKTEVKEHTAEILGLKSVGQDITQPWTVKLEHLWDAMYGQLKADNINIFSSAGPVPDKLYHGIGMIMADMGKTSISVSEERYQRITFEAQQAWREIRKYSVDRYESVERPTDY